MKKKEKKKEFVESLAEKLCREASQRKPRREGIIKIEKKRFK